MQHAIDSTSEIVAQATNQVTLLSERLLHLLSFVPDDKLTWTPSSTAKSSLRIGAHCAVSSQFFANTISGNILEPMPSPEEFFQSLHAAEEKITTRENAIALVKETTAELCKALATVNAENIHATPPSPFGPLPILFWMGQGNEHLAVHTGQMAYLQTIWGDLDNHFG